jgi:hypothetical protein
MDVDFTLLDDGVPSSPSTARYRIDCLTTKRTVTDWTELAPAAVVTISVTPDENAILNSRNVKETKQIVLQTNYGTSTQSVHTSDWVIRNLQGVT